jgi:H+-transporting ATPase
VMGIGHLAFCVAILAFGVYRLNLSPPALQTLAFVSLVLGNEASMYAIRSRRRIWSTPHPGVWVFVSSIADLLIVSVLAVGGILMSPLPLPLVGGVVCAAFIAAFLLDALKTPVFRRLQIA